MAFQRTYKTEQNFKREETDQREGDGFESLISAPAILLTLGT